MKFTRQRVALLGVLGIAGCALGLDQVGLLGPRAATASTVAAVAEAAEALTSPAHADQVVADAATPDVCELLRRTRLASWDLPAPSEELNAMTIPESWRARMHPASVAEPSTVANAVVVTEVTAATESAPPPLPRLTMIVRGAHREPLGAILDGAFVRIGDTRGGWELRLIEDGSDIRAVLRSGGHEARVPLNPAATQTGSNRL